MATKYISQHQATRKARLLFFAHSLALALSLASTLFLALVVMNGELPRSVIAQNPDTSRLYAMVEVEVRELLDEAALRHYRVMEKNNFTYRQELKKSPNWGEYQYKIYTDYTREKIADSMKEIENGTYTVAKYPTYELGWQKTAAGDFVYHESHLGDGLVVPKNLVNYATWSALFVPFGTLILSLFGGPKPSERKPRELTYDTFEVVNLPIPKQRRSSAT